MTLRDKVFPWLYRHWLETPVIAEENEITEAPKDLSNWVSVSFETFGEQVKSIGNPGKNCHRDEGIMFVTLWFASGTSNEGPLCQIEKLRKILRNKNLGDGVIFTTASPAEVASESSDGNWFGYTIEVAYIHDYFA